MQIYFKKIPAEFCPDPIWNNGAVGFFEDGRPNKNNYKRTTRWVLIRDQLRDRFLIQKVIQISILN